MLRSAHLGEQGARLYAFAGAVHDHQAVALGQSGRWRTIRKDTRERWLVWIDASARAAAASQFSPLAHERLPNAPDPVRVFAMELERHTRQRRSRASTARGLSRARNRNGGDIAGLWTAAVWAGVEALSEGSGDDCATAVLLTLPTPEAEQRSAA